MATEGASLAKIYERLNKVANYKPYSANGWTNWATESGDQVTVKKNGESYTAPVHNTSTTWKGAVTDNDLEANGEKERDSVIVSTSKSYSKSGANAVRTNKWMSSKIDQTDSTLRLYVQDNYKQLKAGLDLTSSSAALYVKNMYKQMESGLKLSESSAHLYVRNMYKQMEAGLKLSESSAHLYVRNKYTQMESGLKLSESSAHLYVRNKYTQMESGLKLSESSAHLYVRNKYTQMESGLKLSESSAHLYVRNKYTQMESGLKLSESSAHLYVRNKYTQLESGLKLSESSAHLYVRNKYTEMSSGLKLSESSAHLYVRNRYTEMQSGLHLVSNSAVLYARSADCAAKVVARINESTGSSEIILDASHIKIGQYGGSRVTLNDRVAVDSNGNLYITSNLYVNLDYSHYIQATNYKIVGASSAQGANIYELKESNVSGIINKAEVSNGVLKLWTFNEDKTKDPALTFSRAITSWNPLGWSNGIYTATAQPQNQGVTTRIRGIDTVGDAQRSGTLVHQTLSVNIAPDGTSTPTASGFTQDVYMDASSVYGYGWEKCYDTVGLNYSSDQTIGPGESRTIWAMAKATPNADNKSRVTSVKVTATGSSQVSDISIWEGETRWTNGSSHTIKSSTTIKAWCLKDGTWTEGDAITLSPISTVSIEDESWGNIAKTNPAASSFISGRTKAKTGVLSSGQYYIFQVKFGNNVKNYYLET